MEPRNCTTCSAKRCNIDAGVSLAGDGECQYWTSRHLSPIDANRKQYTIADSGDRREFGTGATRDMGGNKGRCDLLPACALMRLAKHYEVGALKYSDRNWELGVPISSFIDSGLRHLLKYMDGQTDEDHLVAAAWNILGAMWTEEKHPELQDIPARLERRMVGKE